jgi:hypothetical protein
MKKLFGLLVSLLFLFGISFSLLSTIGIIPDSKVVNGEDLNDTVIKDLRAEGILGSNELIHQFYSEDLFSFVDYGNFFTDKRVVSYEIDFESDKRVIYTSDYEYITDIKFVEAESAIDNAYVAIYQGTAEPLFYLAISAESDLDRGFYDELLEKWQASKISATH